MTPEEITYCQELVTAHGGTQFTLLQAMKCTGEDRGDCRSTLRTLIELGCIGEVPRGPQTNGQVGYVCTADTVRRYGSKD